MPKPSHIAADGTVLMVDVGEKPLTQRVARAEAYLRMSPATERALREATLPKGDAFATARIAGILAAKRTAELIPLCHALALSSVAVEFSWSAPGLLRIETVAKTNASTGVEMEALTAAAVAALTLYDMAKAVEKGMVVETVRLLEKTGGKSGPWRAP